MSRNFVVGFSFFFHAKSGSINKHRTESSDISFLSPFKLDSDDIEKTFKNFLCRDKLV